MPLSFTINSADNGQQFVTVWANGVLTTPADDSHPNFQAIVNKCMDHAAGGEVNPQEVLDLFDIPATIERKFQRLSDRVTVEHGKIMFDGDECQPALSTQIIRFMDEGHDFEPLVKFMEKIQSNPQDDSRTQAYAWLNNHAFTITEDGDVVGYKGVSSDGSGGYCSGFAGTAMVNDVLHEDVRIPNAVGDTVTMPRSAVAHDPLASCHTGLHIGTFDYAKGYSTSGAMLRVIVNPRDIVSVPYDAAGEKIRVCRYIVDEIIDSPDAGALRGASISDEWFAVGAHVLVGCEQATILRPDEEGYWVVYDDISLGEEWVHGWEVIARQAPEPATFDEGDRVTCTYDSSYGVGVVREIDEDGDVWVKWPAIAYPCCMSSDEVVPFA